jgi:uncharacterized protein with GYD domain
MATFLMFGKYSAEALKSVSAKRTGKAEALIAKHGGRLKAGYALLGDVDLVLVVELPDNESAMAVSAAMAKNFGIAFSTRPAVTLENFDKLIG